MTNVMMVIMVITNFAFNYDVVGTRPKECPEGRIGCTVYHCEPVYSKTDYTEIKTVTSNTYVVTTINDVSYSNLASSVEIEKLSRSVREVHSAVTSEWEKAAAPEVWNYLYIQKLLVADTNNIIFLFATNSLSANARLDRQEEAR